MALSAFELCEDTFGMSRDDLESIIAFLRSAESRQMSHSDVEKLVRERSYELSRKLFQAHVDSRGPGEAAAPVRGADGVERDQERIHERGLTTIFGEIRVKRFGYGAEGALLHGPEQIADLPVPVAESPGAVRIGHPERSHLVEYLAPNSVFNSLPRQRSSPHLRPDDRLVTIDRVLHHASLGVA